MEAHPCAGENDVAILFFIVQPNLRRVHIFHSACGKEESRMNERPLILASASPRRKYWLEAIRVPFEVAAPAIDEVALRGEGPSEMVSRLSKEKALAIAAANPGRWVLAADTTVALDQFILGKPENPSDAARMLHLIQGRGHCVHTGACLMKDAEIHQLVDTANVHIRPLSKEQICWYVGTGEPMDKAGAYAAQGIAALFIERIEGSFSTVMGLPVERLAGLFFALGLIEEWFPISRNASTV
jgi:septum formation protein